jgi:prepilin-type processing-associated H-X9-DG protein
MTNFRSSRRSAGVTLVEVLVATTVVATLAAVAAVAQPAFVDVPTARVINCRNRLSELAKAMAMYTGDHKDTFAGPNTSGADGQFDNGTSYIGDHTGLTPVSTHDWISPTLGLASALPINRAMRTQTILNNFACPQTTVNNAAMFGSAADSAQFVQRFAAGGFRQVSYLSPSAFHYFGSTTAAAANRYRGITLKASFTTPVRVPDVYRPRLDLLGVQPSHKVYAADGTRYLDAGVLDLDITPSPAVNGALLDPGPIVQTSVAYGRGFASAPASHQLSFRHDGGQMNAAFFDGHIERLTQAQAWTDASRWYPGGSTFNGVGATPESATFHAPGSVLP